MTPNYYDGDYLVISSLLGAKTDDVVVCRIEGIGLVLKRIKYLDQNKLILIGDNPIQESSICNIPLKPSIICGKVILNLSLFRFLSFFSGKNKRFNI